MSKYSHIFTGTIPQIFYSHASSHSGIFHYKKCAIHDDFQTQKKSYLVFLISALIRIDKSHKTYLKPDNRLNIYTKGQLWEVQTYKYSKKQKIYVKQC